MNQVSLHIMYEIIKFIPNVHPFNKNSLEITSKIREMAGKRINSFIKRHFFSSENLEKYVKYKFVKTQTLNSKDYNRIFMKTFLKREQWQFLPERMCANNFPDNCISWMYVDRIPKEKLRSKYDVYKFIQTLRHDQKDVIFRDYIFNFDIKLYD